MKKQILGLSSDLRFFLFHKPVSMQGGIEKLKGLVIKELDRDPTNGDVYIFLSSNRKQIKLLHYENYVFTMYVRRIYKGRFVYPEYDPQKDKYIISMEKLIKLIRGYASRV